MAMPSCAPPHAPRRMLLATRHICSVGSPRATSAPGLGSPRATSAPGLLAHPGACGGAERCGAPGLLVRRRYPYASDGFVAQYNYGETLRRWAHVFPTELLHVVDHEDAVDDINAVLRRFFGFAGLDVGDGSSTDGRDFESESGVAAGQPEDACAFADRSTLAELRGLFMRLSEAHAGALPDHLASALARSMEQVRLQRRPYGSSGIGE